MIDIRNTHACSLSKINSIKPYLVGRLIVKPEFPSIEDYKYSTRSENFPTDLVTLCGLPKPHET